MNHQEEKKQLRDTKNLSESIVAKIKERGLIPRPRWRFILKNWAIWLSGAAALLIGAMAFSVILYLFKYNTWDIYQNTVLSGAKFFLLTLPYFWLLFLALFVFIAYYNLRHTRGGYRYRLYLIIIVPILISIILGMFFFAAGWGQKIDSILGRHAPFYGQVFNRQMMFWFNPEEGRLAGVVVEVSADRQDFLLLDPVGETWTVLSRSGKAFPSFVKSDEAVNVLGSAIDDNEFVASFVKPVGPGREFFMRPEMREKRSCLSGDCRRLEPRFLHQ